METVEVRAILDVDTIAKLLDCPLLRTLTERGNEELNDKFIQYLADNFDDNTLDELLRFILYYESDIREELGLDEEV